MIGSPVLDLILLLSFTYFTGALLLAAINEGVSQGIFRLRQKGLKQGIENLFFNDSDWLPYVRNKFLSSPHIISLLKKKDMYPAYIPSNNFVLTVIENIGAQNYNSASLQTAINNSALPATFKKVLIDLAVKADNNTKEFEKNVAQFYNDAMDRAGGWYKKRIRRMLLLFGVLLSAAMNIDTIKIASDALKDPAKLKQTVDNVMQQVSNIKQVKDTIIITDKKDSIQIALNVSKDTTIAGNGKEIKKTISDFKNIRVVYESTTGLSLGYKSEEDFYQQWGCEKNSAAAHEKTAANPKPGPGAKSSKINLATFFLKLFGILITAFALQLGSNYWFDVLNKVGSVRGVGKKPTESATK